VWDWHRVNSNVALWARDSEEITDDEYKAFYRSLSKDTGEARTWIHFKAEGEVEFKSVLFVPEEAGEIYNNYNDKKAGIRLYVRKVLIQEDFDELLPKYLNFIKGVVDSDDLPLNVSRETLQQHKVLKVMAKKLVRKVLEMLRKLAAEDEDSDAAAEDSADKDSDELTPYLKFWEQFGKSIKMGVIEDAGNKSKLAKLLRYKTSKSDGRYRSLDQYMAAMPAWQTDIYFLAGESVDAVSKSPFLEVARKKGVEVLILTDPLDEYTMQHLGEFDGKKIQSLSKEGLKFNDEDEDVTKKRAKVYKETFKPLTKYLKDLYGAKVGKVTVGQRVETAPAVIVTGQYGNTANMERIMRAQTFADGNAVKSLTASRTLELNPRHPIVVELNKAVDSGSDESSTKDLAWLLYDTALLQSGFLQDDVESFSERMYRTIAKSLDVSSMDLAPELEVEDEAQENDIDLDGGNHEEF